MARTVDASTQEPESEHEPLVKTYCGGKPNYTTPFECPRCGHCCREWVGLTDEEIDKFMPYCHTDQDLSDFRTFAFEIEAKLKEKNT